MRISTSVALKQLIMKVTVCTNLYSMAMSCFSGNALLSLISTSSRIRFFYHHRHLPIIRPTIHQERLLGEEAMTQGLKGIEFLNERLSVLE